MQPFELQAADEKELSDIKEWFFAENIRLSEERDKLEEDRRCFEREKNAAMDELNGKIIKAEMEFRQLEERNKLVTEQLNRISREYNRIEAERKSIEEEKETFEKIKKFRRPTQNSVTYVGTDFLFKGVKDENSLKKRYRDLLKIFHPDNLSGDTSVIQNINKEYEALKKLYG